MMQNTTEGKAANKKVELIRVDRLYESLRYNEYTPDNGLGEIVDNSVEAGSTRIDVRITKVKESRSKGKSRTKIEEIAVVDNGCGMDAVTLSKCLALGESLRTTSKGKLGIGRFGVGMTLGSISLARRVEVYSRTNVDSNFLYTYIDLEEIKNCELLHIPFPKPNAPHEKYRHLLDGCTGTIVVLKDCDRIEGDWEGLANYLGRTYRKFIERGLKITIGIQAANEAEFRIDPVYLHDPLYMAGPTKFDADAKAQGKPMDPKAVDWGTIHIPLEISNQPGKTADVIIRLTLLPEEWRMFKGDGGNAEAKKEEFPRTKACPSFVQIGKCSMVTFHT